MSDCLTIYDADGKAISNLGLYERNGLIFGARYYSGQGCAAPTTAESIAQKAKLASSRPTIYIQTRPGECLTVPDVTQNSGSL